MEPFNRALRDVPPNGGAMTHVKMSTLINGQDTRTQLDLDILYIPNVVFVDDIGI